MAGSQPWARHSEDNNFVQAGELYRLMSAREKQQLIENIAGQLAVVSREDVVEHSISYFRQADAEYGDRLTKAVKALRSKKA